MLVGTMGVESDRYDWRDRNPSTVVLAFVRALRDPALAWDVAMEAMAAATLVWTTFPGGSRMAWVVEHGKRVLQDAEKSGHVSSRERTRNRASADKTLSVDEQQALWERARDGLELDADAALSIESLARDAPPPRVLLEIGLSPLTRRAPGRVPAPERDHG